MAGWANSQNHVAVHPTVAGTTGTTLAFASNVTAGQVIAAASLYAVGSTQTPTFSDTQGNVTSWTTSTFANATVGANIAIAWGIASTTGPCTGKVVWNLATSTVVELYIASFNTPGGTVSQDGTTTTATGTATTTVTTPAGNGVGSNDLVLNMVGFGLSWSSLGGSWLRMDGGTSTGDMCAYLLNAAGNSAPSQTQTGSSTFMSMTLALQASGAASAPTFMPGRMPLGA